MSAAMLPVRSTTRVAVLVAVASIAFAMTGCAAKPTTGGTQAETTRLGQDPTASATTELVRVAGTVVVGTQPDCLVLDTGFGRYVLVGGDRAALTQAAGNDETITVTGQAHTPAPAPCADGIPLAVEKIVPST